LQYIRVVCFANTRVRLLYPSLETKYPDAKTFKNNCTRDKATGLTDFLDRV